MEGGRGGGRKGKREEFHPEKLRHYLEMRKWALAAGTAHHTCIPFTILKGEGI